MSQISIEWYAKQTAKITLSALRGGMTATEHRVLQDTALIKAKEMHKQELEAFFEAGMKYGMDISISNDIGCDAEQPNFETFYNETFKK